MSQAGAVSGAGGGGGITIVSPGLGISVSTVGTTATVTNTGTIQYVSPEIDFKVVQDTTIFTSKATQNFLCTALYVIFDSANSPNNNSISSVGITPSSYSDLISSGTFSFTSLNNYNVFFSSSGLQSTVIPPNAAVVCSFTSGDTGTALTGRVIIQGFYT